MVNYDHLKTILNQATNEYSIPKPTDVVVNTDFGVFLFGQEAVDFTKMHKYNGVTIIILSGPVDMAINYGDYDPRKYM